MSNFPPLEVVGRGSETQFQVAENFIKLADNVNAQQIETNIKLHDLGFNVS